MNTIIYIYTLSHPITNEVRYVGKTINIKRRYKQHLYDKRQSYKSCWVQSLRKDNLKPILNIIEECTIENWEEREIYWISQYDNLTNFSLGGGSNYVRITSEETKKKISAKLSGRNLTPQHIKNISNNSKKSKIISIDNVIYNSITEASKHFNTNIENISYKCKSKNFPNYLYI